MLSPSLLYMIILGVLVIIVMFPDVTTAFDVVLDAMFVQF